MRGGLTADGASNPPRVSAAAGVSFMSRGTVGPAFASSSRRSPESGVVPQAFMRSLPKSGSWYHNGPMPRSMWSGAISFGLVNVPVKLYSAVSRKTVRFHQLNGKTGTRIAQKRVDPSTGDEVAYEDIVK